MTWTEVLYAARTGQPLWYKAPLDFRPARVSVVRVFKNGKIRLMNGSASFTADVGHADRFVDFHDDLATRVVNGIAMCRAKWDGVCDSKATHTCPTYERPPRGATHCRKHAIAMIKMLTENAIERIEREVAELRRSTTLFVEHASLEEPS